MAKPTENGLSMPAEGHEHPIIEALHRYWEGKRGDRAMPARRDIDPLEMGAQLLPHLLLSDIMERGGRIRLRLVGTQVVKRFGFDPTGQHLDEALPGGYFGLLATLHRVVFAERRPVRSESMFRWGASHRLHVHQLLLPLSMGGSEPAIALVGLAFRSDDVFPPQIRTLNEIATHSETRRQVLPLAAPPPRSASGASVA